MQCTLTKKSLYRTFTPKLLIFHRGRNQESITYRISVLYRAKKYIIKFTENPATIFPLSEWKPAWLFSVPGQIMTHATPPKPIEIQRVPK